MSSDMKQAGDGISARHCLLKERKSLKLAQTHGTILPLLSGSQELSYPMNNQGAVTGRHETDFKTGSHLEHDHGLLEQLPLQKALVITTPLPNEHEYSHPQISLSRNFSWFCTSCADGYV